MKIDKGPQKIEQNQPTRLKNLNTDIQNVFISIWGFFFNTIIFGIHSSDFYGVYLTPLVRLGMSPLATAEFNAFRCAKLKNCISPQISKLSIHKKS